MFVFAELGPQFGNELTGVIICSLHSSLEDKKTQSRLTPVDQQQGQGIILFIATIIRIPNKCLLWGMQE